MGLQTQRPIGVTILAAVNTVWVIPWAILSILSNFEDGVVPDNPPYILALSVATLMTIVGAWMGNRNLRTAMLVLMTFVQLLLIVYGVLTVDGMLRVPPEIRYRIGGCTCQALV
jgi:hypothetical protein